METSGGSACASSRDVHMDALVLKGRSIDYSILAVVHPKIPSISDKSNVISIGSYQARDLQMVPGVSDLFKKEDFGTQLQSVPECSQFCTEKGFCSPTTSMSCTQNFSFVC